jgi:hypothetical protein
VVSIFLRFYRGHRGRDRMVVGITTTCAIKLGSFYYQLMRNFFNRFWKIQNIMKARKQLLKKAFVFLICF